MGGWGVCPHCGVHPSGAPSLFCPDLGRDGIPRLGRGYSMVQPNSNFSITVIVDHHRVIPCPVDAAHLYGTALEVAKRPNHLTIGKHSALSEICQIRSQFELGRLFVLFSSSPIVAFLATIAGAGLESGAKKQKRPAENNVSTGQAGGVAVGG